MSKKNKSEGGIAVQLVDSIRFVTKRPEFCAVDADDNVIETVWQIGRGRFFLAPGTDKPSKKGAEFLGHYEGVVKGKHTFQVSLPTDLPSHSTPTQVIQSESFYGALSLSYAARRGLKCNGQPVLSVVSKAS